MTYAKEDKIVNNMGLIIANGTDADKLVASHLTQLGADLISTYGPEHPNCLEVLDLIVKLTGVIANA